MKRYLLLENKEIVDTTKEEMEDDDGWYEFLNDKQLEWHGYNSAVGAVDIIKETDNLLDLIDVGDCVEYKDNNHLDYNITFIESDAFIDQFKHIDNEEVIAIWKRNGDIMRRYGI